MKLEKSNEELLTGIAKLERQNPFPDEIFYRIFEIEDNVERQKYIEALRNEAKVLKRSTEFNNLLKQFQLDYIQRMRQTGNKTAFTDQPAPLHPVVPGINEILESFRLKNLSDSLHHGIPAIHCAGDAPSLEVNTVGLAGHIRLLDDLSCSEDCFRCSR